jgi:oligo-1,6-glucosidase
MTNYPFSRLDQFNDIEVKNTYQERVLGGKMPEAQFIAESQRFGRDNSRTPIQWSSAPNAGFTTAEAKPWLAVNPNYASINVAAELTNPDSVYHYTRRAISLRHAHLALVYGDYQDLDPKHPQVFAYTRTLTDPGKPTLRFLVVLNFSKEPIDYTLPEGVKAGELLLANVAGTSEADKSTLHLVAWDARVYSY